METVTSAQVLTGRTLRRMRESHGVSLRSCATMVGVSPSHLSRVESGYRLATPSLTQRINAALAGLPVRS